jgi:hypothetical protein
LVGLFEYIDDAISEYFNVYLALLPPGISELSKKI